MYPPQASCRCGDCKLFGSLASQPNACSWGVPESKGADSTFARQCALFSPTPTDTNHSSIALKKTFRSGPAQSN